MIKINSNFLSYIHLSFRKPITQQNVMIRSIKLSPNLVFYARHLKASANIVRLRANPGAFGMGFASHLHSVQLCLDTYGYSCFFFLFTFGFV